MCKYEVTFGGIKYEYGVFVFKLNLTSLRNIYIKSGLR